MINGFDMAQIIFLVFQRSPDIDYKGKKLKQLSENCQLIVITHLHQIARMADHHFVAEKTDNKKKAIINLKFFINVSYAEPGTYQTFTFFKVNVSSGG